MLVCPHTVDYWHCSDLLLVYWGSVTHTDDASALTDDASLMLAEKAEAKPSGPSDKRERPAYGCHEKLPLCRWRSPFGMVRPSRAGCWGKYECVTNWQRGRRVCGAWWLFIGQQAEGALRGDVAECGLMLPLRWNVIFLFIKQAGVLIRREVWFIRLIFQRLCSSLAYVWICGYYDHVFTDYYLSNALMKLGQASPPTEQPPDRCWWAVNSHQVGAGNQKCTRFMCSDVTLALRVQVITFPTILDSAEAGRYREGEAQ